MTTAVRYHAWSTAAAVLSALLVTVAAEAPLLGATTAPLIALSWALFRRTGLSPIPRWLCNAMVIAATLNLARQLVSPDHRLEDSIARLAEFLVVILTVKMLENRTARDQMQAIALTAMAAIGAILSSVTLGVALLTAAYIVSAINTIVLFQFVRNDALARGDTLFWTNTHRSQNTEAGFIVPLRWTMIVALPALCAGTTAIFLLLPRDLGKQMLGAWNPRTSASTTGFTDEVQLGFSGIVTESEDIVMEVTLEIAGRTSILTDPQYFRGAVLDLYDAERGRWRRAAAAADRDRRIPSQFVQATPDPEPDPRFIRQRVKIRSRNTDHLFALLSPVWGQTSARSRISPNEIDATIRFEGARGPMRYEVVSDPHARESRSLDRNNDHPFLDGPVREYAAEILRRRRLERPPGPLSDPDDHRRVEVFRQHLATTFQYTLELEAPPPGRDPIEWFLLEGQKGSCEYFAAALAAMCRSVGIEARVITGYMTNEADESSGAYIVRSRHAHAWVEALVPVTEDPAASTGTNSEVPLRWRTYDATPLADSSRLMGNAANIWARIRRAVERLESAWLNAVVAFDGERQAEVLGPALGPMGWLGTLNDRISAARQSWASRAVTTAAAFAAGFTLVAGALATLRFILAHHAARRAAPTSRARSATPAARLAARTLARLDRTLRRAGAPRPAWAGPLDHAHALAARLPGPGAIADRIVRACYAVRFGSAGPDALASAHDDLRRLAHDLAAARRSTRRTR